MRKLTILLLPLILTACNGLGSKKIKTIVEMTPKLLITSSRPIILGKHLAEKSIDRPSPTYQLSKNVISTKPIFAEGVIYALDQRGIVTAFTQKDKKILWSCDVASKSSDYNHLGGGIAYHNHRLYITNGSRFLVIINDQGREILRKEFPDIIRTKPVILNDQVILVQTISNQLFAYNIKDFSLAWQHEGATEILSYSNYIEPIIYRQQVIVLYTSGQIAALDARTAEEKWSLDLAHLREISLPDFEPAALVCSPVVRGSDLIIATSKDKLIKVDLLTGLVKWQTSASDVQSMSVYDDNLFITNNAKQVACINLTDGQIQWSANLEPATKIGKAKAFLPPFISQAGVSWALKVMADSGEIYSFPVSNSNYLPDMAVISKTIKGIKYKGVTAGGDIFLVTDKKITFIEG